MSESLTYLSGVKNLTRKKRMICCVVAAEASSIEQRQLLRGITEQNQQREVDTVVLSNIYNPNIKSQELDCENMIYDIINSEDIDYIIILIESFVNADLRKTVLDRVFRRNIPIIVVGSMEEQFDNDQIFYVNTNDVNDIEDVTNHFIEVHGFTDIHLITGWDILQASHTRVVGYRRALESHGIPFDENKVFFGDFWTSSGIDLANRYYSGELKMPQGIVCANDYMAYGLLDRFAELGISVPEDVSVIGYEYIAGREMHTPFLTTYQRNRYELGIIAAKKGYSVISGTNYEYTSPSGSVIHGDSCPCGAKKETIIKELRASTVRKDFENFNLFNTLDQELTLARTLVDFLKVCGTYHWRVKDVNDIIFCLFKNWYDSESEPSESLSCMSIVPWETVEPFDFRRNALGQFLNRWDNPCCYYFTPLFFNDRFFGYSVLKYDYPMGYFDSYRNWIKSVSNGLEFLRMKNDIKYLTQCQNLSEKRDTLTGMLNENGLRGVYQILSEEENAVMVVLKVCISYEVFSNIDGKVEAIVDSAEAVRQFCGSRENCGRVNDSTFVCIIREECEPETAADKLSSVLIQHREYMEKCGMDSFICTAVRCEGRSYSELYEECGRNLEEKGHELEKLKNQPHYSEMLRIRSYIYMNPQESYEPDKLRKLYPYSTGHLRELYKKCFGVSIHQDCISARISRAKYYLTATPMNMSEIAERCGYVDSKYFLRQFMSAVGMTPGRYRNAAK